MLRSWRQHQNTRHCLRCLISAVASLWLAVVAPLLCSIHDGTHNHLLSSHHVAAAAAETHEHAVSYTHLDVYKRQ